MDRSCKSPIVSTKTAISVDRCSYVSLASIKTPLFVDRSFNLRRPENSPNFWPPYRLCPRWPEKSLFSWPVLDCETGDIASRQRDWQICRPAAQSKLRELRRRARSAALCPEPNLRTLSALSPSYKRQSRHADSNARREDRPQRDKACMQG